MLHSLYAKEFFKAFEWIVKLIHKHREPPESPCPKPPCPKPPEPSCPIKPPCNNHCNCSKTGNTADIQEISDLPYDGDIQRNRIETDANISDNTPAQPQTAQRRDDNQNSLSPGRRGYRRRILGDRVDFLNSPYNSDYNDEDDD